MTDPRFADIEVLLVLLLQGMAGGAEHCDTETPENLFDVLPFIRARKVGGDRDRLLDRPVVEIDAFGPSRAVVVPLADAVFELLMGKPSPSPAIDSTVCGEGPRELPWGDGRIRRWSATYAFDLRRTRLALT